MLKKKLIPAALVAASFVPIGISSGEVEAGLSSCSVWASTRTGYADCDVVDIGYDFYQAVAGCKNNSTGNVVTRIGVSRYSGESSSSYVNCYSWEHVNWASVRLTP